MRKANGMRKKNSNNKAIAQTDTLVEKIRPMLAGLEPGMQGAVVANLLAIFISGHAPELREDALELLLDYTKDLIPIYINEMISAGRVPEDWLANG